MTITKLVEYESAMTTFGAYLSAHLADPTISDEQKLSNVYYDAQYVFYRIATYTNDHATWNLAAERAEAIYRDYYLIPSNAQVPGFWAFTEGLKESWLRTQDGISKTWAINISNNAAYHSEVPDTLTDLADDLFARENAYALLSHLNAELLGAPRRERIYTLVDNALGHIDAWVNETASYCKPFFTALTCRSLIRYNDMIGDSRIVPAIESICDYIWDNLWDAGAEAFLYIHDVYPGEDPPDPAPDLNMLIVPSYGYLYSKTFDSNWLTIGDQIFDGGVPIYDEWGFHVSGAYLGQSNSAGVNGKHFDQQFLWSMDYLTWAQAVEPISGGMTGFGDIARVFNIGLRLDAKVIKDSGSQTVTDAASGAVVQFNKSFVDIKSLHVTPQFSSSYPLTAVYDFQDVPNPTSFIVYLYRTDTGAKVTGNFSWFVEGY